MKTQIIGNRKEYPDPREISKKMNEQVLAEEKAARNKKPEQTPEEPKIAVPNSVLTDKYIYLPEHKLYVATQTSLHGKNWQDAWTELEKQGKQMLTIKQYVDFLNLLKVGIAGHSVYDSKGEVVGIEELSRIYDEIASKRNPWRAEHLDAYFEKCQNKLYLLTEKKKKGEPLESCLMKDKIPGIDLEDWLQNANSQGLPEKNVKQGSLYYRHPKSGRVAGFYSNSDRVSLDCDGGRDPDYSYSALGVREVISAENPKNKKEFEGYLDLLRKTVGIKKTIEIIDEKYKEFSK